MPGISCENSHLIIVSCRQRVIAIIVAGVSVARALRIGDNNNKSRQVNMDDETLNRLAAEALLEEAKLGARRAEIMGPSGWVKPKETVNKRFLHSTLRNAVISNKHRSLKQEKVKVQPRKTDAKK